MDKETILKAVVHCLDKTTSCIGCPLVNKGDVCGVYLTEYISSKGLAFIPPYKLAEMTRLSNKIVKLLTDNISAVTLSYDDMKTVLRIVSGILEQGVHEK